MIRDYLSKDKLDVLTLIKDNTPKYFDYSEYADLSDYLDNYREDYYVYEKDNKIIGAGGINYFFEDKIARISWDIIHPDYQGKGIGRKLTEFRINNIVKSSKIDIIAVRTTQLVYQFYQKNGFKLDNIKKDYWAEGFDLYHMTLKINR